MSMIRMFRSMPVPVKNPQEREYVYDIIGAFGTCVSDAESGRSWRDSSLIPILGKYGVDHRIFNPEVAVWTPDRALVESRHMARDKVLAVGIGNQSESHASVLDAGFAAYGGSLRGQQVIISIQNDEHTPVACRRGRNLANAMLRNLQDKYPFFTMVDTIEELSHRAAFSLLEYDRQNSGLMIRPIDYLLPLHREDLEPVIYLAGTAGTQKPAWMQTVKDHLDGYQVPVDDSYRADWTETNAYDELAHKSNKAVQLIAITEETESLGVLAELAPRIMQADLSGQSIGVYIEHHISSPMSASNRTRSLAMQHIRRLKEDFSNLPLFLADNLQQLAIFGLCEYYKHSQDINNEKF